MAILRLDPARARAWIPLVAMGLCGVGCMLLSDGSPPEDTFGFDHSIHASQNLECSDCHGDVESSDEEARMPRSAQCMLCHKDLDKTQPPEKQASAFFIDGTLRAAHVSMLSDEVIFSHGAHVARGEECATCHGDIASSRRVPRDAGVTMDECIACHASKGRSDGCEVCHREIRSDLAPPTHDLAWDKVHGKVVRAHSLKMADRCSLCHTESTCATCHADTPPENHDNFWRIKGHGVVASIDRENCAACHRPDSCQRCHEETLPLSHNGMWGAPRDNHCLSCHMPLGGNGCVVCHKGTPSHALATPLPPGHTPAMNCRQCHGAGQPLPHVDNGMTCTACHM